MTGIAFLKRLTFQLDFLNEFDQKTVIAFYERKLSGASTLLEEEAIVKSFGSPEHIAKKLKEAYLSHLAAAESASKTEKHDENDFKSGSEKAVDSENADNAGSDTSVMEHQDEESSDDLIFSKPSVPKKAAEMIHSLENKEVKSLYGEKVVIEDRTEPVEEIVIEPIDDENGLTEEEIRLAKEETLEKANSFTTAAIEIPQELLNEEKTLAEESKELPTATEQPTIAIETELVEEARNVEETANVEIAETVDDSTGASPEEIHETDSSSVVENDEISLVDKEDTECGDDEKNIEGQYFTEELIPIEKKSGLITRLFPAAMSKTLRVFLSVLLSVIVSPILLIVFGVGVLSYTIAAITVLAVALLAFAMMATLIVFGVAELIYGFSSLFDTVSVALIEIGIGTVVFGIVTAIAALIYEFLFGIIPRAIKSLTKFFVMYLKKVSNFLYGGNT